ncbi:hypothetical protein C7475_101830 [Chitinophaga sp. S165]|nr:hypothetical protein C7475_101830 [Chitinophaga sp. S165]
MNDCSFQLLETGKNPSVFIIYLIINYLCITDDRNDDKSLTEMNDRSF